MPFRQVVRATKLGGQIASHARQHAERVATSAAAEFRDLLLPDRPYPDLREYQVWVGEKLDGLHAELILIDKRHARQLEIARQLRDQREDWVKRLRPALRNLKDTADGSYGPGGSRAIFQEDPRIPDDPVALYQLAERIYDTLADPGFALETSLPGVVVNPAALAEGFAEPLHGLGSTLTRLQEAESEIGHTQSLKEEHLERLVTYNGKVARFYEALFDLAGHERLARRLRRSSHLRPVPEEPDTGATPAGDGEPAAAAEDLPPAVSDEAAEEATS